MAALQIENTRTAERTVYIVWSIPYLQVNTRFSSYIPLYQQNMWRVQVRLVVCQRGYCHITTWDLGISSLIPCTMKLGVYLSRGWQVFFFTHFTVGLYIQQQWISRIPERLVVCQHSVTISTGVLGIVPTNYRTFCRCCVSFSFCVSGSLMANGARECLAVWCYTLCSLFL